MTLGELQQLADGASTGIWKAAYWPLPQPHHWIGIHDNDLFSSRLKSPVTGPIYREGDARLIELTPRMATLLVDAVGLIEDEGWQRDFKALDDPFGFRTESDEVGQ